ncbi:MAG: hypothetical protein KQH79_05790 [Bacteroidetes bacterium]|nr:hypothetical protein [Bacteroidota bacterium]
MKKKYLSILIIMFISCYSLGQTPESFKYQAVVRNSSDEILSNQDISLRTSIYEGNNPGTNVYSETHTVTTSEYGVISINIGSGTSVSGDFDQISWSTGNKYLKIEVDASGGSTYTELSTVQLLAVPYAIHSESANSAKSAEILGDNNIYTPISDTLFVVKDHDGNVVFAVFPDGAAVYVNEGAKGKVGGFAISGRSPNKAIEEDYLIVTADSTRIYYTDTTDTKGKVGGFAISGRSPNKGSVTKLMDLTQKNYFIGHEAGVNTTTGIFNTFFGYNSGYSNTEGDRNIFIGRQSGFSNIDGYSNVMIGDSAGYENLSGYTNVFLGNNTGQKNIDGYQNVILGNWAGYHNTSGYRNIFVGTAAGYDNTEGEINIFLGNLTGHYNTTGSHNVYLGNWAGLNSDTASLNVFIGNSAGYDNYGGHENIFIGNTSGHSNTIGSGNTLIGGVSGYHNTTGSYNTFVGMWTGNEHISGNDNVFLGVAAGHNSYTGSSNVFIGPGAGHSNFSGDSSVFIGTEAGYSESNSHRLYIENTSADSSAALIYGEFDNDFLRLNADVVVNGKLYFGNDQDNILLGEYAGIGITSGTGNTFIGNATGGATNEGTGNTFIGLYSGNENTSGNQNVFIGLAAGHNSNSGSKNIAIGPGAGHNVADADSSIFIGLEAGYFEDKSSRLYIENSSADSSAALIYGEFDNDILIINGETHIRDVLILKPRDAAPTNPEQGMMYMDAITNKLMVYDGSTWQACW